MSNAIAVDSGAAPKFTFGGRLTADFPSQIIVDLTEVCNLECIHCPHPIFKKSSEYGARYLDPKLNAKLVDEVRTEGTGRTQYIRYTSNGEPLVHPNAYDIIQHAVDRSGTRVTITTNGTIMNEKRTRKLLDSGVHMIDISIDAFRPETYARVRVGGDLAVTQTNVKRLLDWVRQSGAPTKVVVSFVEQPENSGEVESFRKYWEDAGADKVLIRRLHSAAGSVEQVVRFIRNTQELTERYPCLYPWERILLNPRGQLAFCPQDWFHKSVLADYRDTSIVDLWRSQAYADLRKAHTSNDFANHKFCGQCPDWKSTRWPGQGLSYADVVEELLIQDART